jgi:hypothetical protein
MKPQRKVTLTLANRQIILLYMAYSFKLETPGAQGFWGKENHFNLNYNKVSPEYLTVKKSFWSYS